MLLGAGCRCNLAIFFFFFEKENTGLQFPLTQHFLRFFGFLLCTLLDRGIGMEAEFCAGHTPCSSQEESGEELSVLPRHTKVIITGNNRTKSVLVGLQGVVKKAVGLGGWHWLVLKNGVEVKLQRNALSVLETPTGDEDEDEIVYGTFYSTSVCAGSEFYKSRKTGVPHTRSLISCGEFNGRSGYDNTQSNGFKTQTRVNLSRLGTTTLWRYWRHFDLVSGNPNPTKEQMVHGVQCHFLSQKQLDEKQVIEGFIHAAKRLKRLHS
ncbi:uncharacterized protein LOC122028581 isoform X1 [Zingiber officinale]|uniref:uncharacterized protein LOC122028581 isoform X1 n=2 Tax=Zingiber officinale TaxID=94328 RepID=UPI001C4C6774|nr:uncharacterized protein LOC122028581 isoform X1 [Zingiber officinale]